MSRDVRPSRPGRLRPFRPSRLSRALWAVLAVLCLLAAASAVAAKGGKHGDEEKKGKDRDEGDDGGDDGDDGRDDGDDDRRERRHRDDDLPVRHAVKAAASGASVQVLATPTPGRLMVTVLAARSADDPASVTLEARLPDVGSAWHLAAASLDGCTLDGLLLSCSVGLATGEAGLVQAAADVTAPPGWAAEATAQLTAPGDAAAGDGSGAARAGLLLL